MSETSKPAQVGSNEGLGCMQCANPYAKGIHTCANGGWNHQQVNQLSHFNFGPARSATKHPPSIDMRWIPVSERVPEPEVFVLCWDGKRCFIDWWGSKRDNGNGATHWMAFQLPPGASDMYDGRRA